MEKKIGNSQGFTLIEVMIVVAVIAIIASIAYPNYKEYVTRTKRVELQTHLVQIAQNLENYRLVNHQYGGASLSTLGGDKFPIQGDANYQIVLTDNAGVALTASGANTQTWLLIARPISTGQQKGNGAVSMSSSGIKCWYKGKDSANVVASKDSDGKDVAPESCTEKW